jgi:hypothetical protein
MLLNNPLIIFHCINFLNLYTFIIFTLILYETILKIDFKNLNLQLIFEFFNHSNFKYSLEF